MKSIKPEVEVKDEIKVKDEPINSDPSLEDQAMGGVKIENPTAEADLKVE